MRFALLIYSKDFLNLLIISYEDEGVGPSFQ